MRRILKARDADIARLRDDLEDARRDKAKLRDMLNELNDGLTHIKDGGT